MTELGDDAGRTEQLRAGFQQQGVAALAQDAGRERAQKRRAHTVVAVAVAVIGAVLLAYRLIRGDHAGAWTALIAAGICLAALGAFLARRDLPRLAFTATLIGLAVMSASDMVTHAP
ncbi:hypothetical protein ACIRPT_13620 [Streptomyces sp. NPDC101227]|uniref:hypothetical protein n=1 Tax=Streptomyces sp. NPDC101227 TaxID=3366136 RepID=UPI003812F566